mgnify:CR=1 FL=1
MSEVTHRKGAKAKNANQSNETEVVEKGKSRLQSVGGELNQMKPANSKQNEIQNKITTNQASHNEEDEDDALFDGEEEDMTSDDDDDSQNPYKTLLEEKQEQGFWAECCADCFWQTVSVCCIVSGVGTTLCIEPCYKLAVELYYMAFG